MHPPAFPIPDKMTEGWPHWSILVVDDEEGMRHFLTKTLAPRCHYVTAASSAEEGDLLLREQRFDLVVLDISLPGKSGIAWLKELREQGYSGEVILITAFADLETAIEALRAGAADFILKPFRMPQILNAVKHSHERARLLRENYVLRRDKNTPHGGNVTLVGDSPTVQALRGSVERLSAFDTTVLLQGESGTGKELVARALHARSARASGPFVPLHCASVSPDLMESELFGHAKGAFAGASRARDGLFYYAQGGTLFFDEIAELPLPIQAMLLRTIEDLKIRPVGSQQLMAVDVRIIAATSRRLAEEVAAGRFRADLYYRLQVVELGLPALREHPSDIPALVAHFMGQLAPALRVPPLRLDDAQMGLLQSYHWPGNVWELRNLIERSLILGQLNVSALYPTDPPAPLATDPSATVIDLPTLEKRHILQVLESVSGDKSRAAQLLGISRRTLERRVAEWQMG